MNCNEFEQEWSDQVETRLRRWSREAEQHLHDCATCRSLIDGEATVDAAIAAWRSVPVPAVPAARLLAAVLAEKPPRIATPDLSSVARAKQRMHTGWVTVTAAATLMIVGWSLWQQPLNPPRPQLASDLAAITDEPVPVTATVAELWLDVRDGSASAARRTVSSWDPIPAISQFARAEPQRPDHEQSLPPESPPQLPPVQPRSTGSELLSGWSHLSRPIGQHVGTALQFLGTVLPDDSSPAS